MRAFAARVGSRQNAAGRRPANRGEHVLRPRSHQHWNEPRKDEPLRLTSKPISPSRNPFSQRDTMKSECGRAKISRSWSASAENSGKVVSLISFHLKVVVPDERRVQTEPRPKPSPSNTVQAAANPPASCRLPEMSHSAVELGEYCAARKAEGFCDLKFPVMR
jgi:hypothetical protein